MYNYLYREIPIYMQLQMRFLGICTEELIGTRAIVCADADTSISTVRALYI